jgi:hypothetical protein
MQWVASPHESAERKFKKPKFDGSTPFVHVTPALVVTSTNPEGTLALLALAG